MNSKENFNTSLRIDTANSNSWILSPNRSLSLSPKQEEQDEEKFELDETETKSNVSSYFWFSNKKRTVNKQTKTTPLAVHSSGESKEEVVIPMMEEPMSPPGQRYVAEDRPELCSPQARFVDYRDESHIMPSLSMLIEEETGFYLTEQARRGVELSPEPTRLFLWRNSESQSPVPCHTMSPRENAPSRTEDIPSIRLE